VAAELDAASNNWNAAIALPIGATVDVEVLWTENFRGVSLPLAFATRMVSVPFDINELAAINIPPNTYNTNFDADSDSFSNLIERNSNTDPLDASSPGDPIIQVGVQLRIAIPEALANANAQTNATPTATLNDAAVLLSFDGTVWTGTTTAIANSDAFLVVMFPGETYPPISLAAAQISENVGNGTVIDVAPTAYNTDLDSDNDGLTNVEEYNQGNTDPTAPTDPRVDPCEISTFNPRNQTSSIPTMTVW